MLEGRIPLRSPSVVLRPHGEDPQKILEAYLEYMQLPPFEELGRTNHLWAPRKIKISGN